MFVKIGTFLLKLLKNMKMVVFWDVAPCSLVSEVFTVSIFALIIEAASSSETLVRLHGTTSQKIVISILVAVRT
jgi:hypothetical protein